MQSPQISEYVYTPPTLPAHLSNIYDLKPILGVPTHEKIKMIHAVIGAVEAGSRIPELYDPDLSLQLSQHLFSVQMAVYREKFPVNVFPGDNTYTPPSLPAYIPIKLDPVTGPPSKEQLRAAQNAMRAVESLGNGPLFDSDVKMELSQHVFNLQFAQYIRASTWGQFVPRSKQAPVTQESQAEPMPRTDADAVVPPEPIQEAPRANAPQPPVAEPVNPEGSPVSESPQQTEVLKDIKELTSESKGVLENINRVLTAMQRNQVTVEKWDHHVIVHANPVNDQGIPATECGLPQLRYSYQKGSYWLTSNANTLAGYLKFFGIGADLIEGDTPRLKSEKWNEAEAALFKHIGLKY